MGPPEAGTMRVQGAPHESARYRKISDHRPTTTEKTMKDQKPVSIETAARVLGHDRRTVKAAIEAAAKTDHLEPADHDGTRGSARWHLADVCEALRLHEIRRSKPDETPWTEAAAKAHAIALSLPCPRCGGLHVEAPL